MCHVTDIFTAPSETKKQIITSRIILNESDLYYDLYTCTIYALLYKITLAGKIAARYQSALCKTGHSMSLDSG